MEPLTIIVSFDVGEQVVPGGIPVWVASLVHEFSFQSTEAAFHRCIVPAISLSAHRLNHPGRAENLAVIGSGKLAAAIGMVDQAGRRLLPLDGHGQGCDGQFRPHVVTHRPADDFAGEEIEHDGQIEPPFLGWQWSKKRISASPPRTVRAPFSAYGSPFKRGPWPLRHPDIVR